jgi:hypothetical protein
VITPVLPYARPLWSECGSLPDSLSSISLLSKATKSTKKGQLIRFLQQYIFRQGSQHSIGHFQLFLLPTSEEVRCTVSPSYLFGPLLFFINTLLIYSRSRCFHSFALPREKPWLFAPFICLGIVFKALKVWLLSKTFVGSGRSKYALTSPIVCGYRASGLNSSNW